MSDIRNGMIVTLVSLVFLALVFAGGLIRSAGFFMNGLALYKVAIDTDQLSLSPQEKQAVPEAESISYWGECVTVRGNVNCSPAQVGFIEDAGSLATILRGNRTTELPLDTMNKFQHSALRFALTIAVAQLFFGICLGAVAELSKNRLSTGATLVASILGLAFIAVALECYVVRIVQVRSILSAATPGVSVAPGPGLYLLFTAAVVQIFAVATFAHACVIVHRRSKQKERMRLGPMAAY